MNKRECKALITSDCLTVTGIILGNECAEFVLIKPLSILLYGSNLFQMLKIITS
jgi:hypothetical protein